MSEGMQGYEREDEMTERPMSGQAGEVEAGPETGRVWLLMGSAGEYDDFREWVVRAYESEALAERDRQALIDINVLARERRGKIHDREAAGGYKSDEAYFAALDRERKRRLREVETYGDDVDPCDDAFYYVRDVSLIRVRDVSLIRAALSASEGQDKGER
jgi:hypothetical protein